MSKIGFTTSIPIEVIYASKNVPVDLNNIFINSDDPLQLIYEAEECGFPRNFCSWIKGIFITAKKENLSKIIIVKEGECSNTEKLAEVFKNYGITCIPFSYPYGRQEDMLRNEIDRIMNIFDVDWNSVKKTKDDLDRIRNKLSYLDMVTYSNRNISGFENYYWLISSTDFNGDYTVYENKLDIFLNEVQKRDYDIYNKHVKIGLIGIPPIVNNLFDEIEKMKGIVVFNEMPRQFSMVHHALGLIQQYVHFTYPYDINMRIDDIQKEIKKRNIDGIIHYIQSFCPRQIDDVIIRNSINIPYLTLECDKPGKLDERNITRLEAFFERFN